MTESIVVEDDRVILRGELAEEVLMDITWDQTRDIEKFRELFKIVGQFQASDDRYQGLDMCTVIERKSDSRQFGYMWWDDISKHGESTYESNGDEHGIEVEYDDDWVAIGGEPYVWLPVEPFTIRGFRVAAATKETK